jgi:Amt family ammonium transporter
VFFATQYVKRVLKIDDSLDVSPVHGVGGIIGTLFAGLFAAKGLGMFSGKGLADGVSIAHQLGVQLLGVIAVLVYTAVITFVVLKITALFTKGLRVSAEEENEGLDLIDHDERGYVL